MARATAAIRRVDRGVRAERKEERNPALAATPDSSAAHPAGWSPAAVRRSKRSGRQGLSLGTGAAAALSRLRLHLFHLRRDRAGLARELHVLGVMILELADRLVRERAPVLVLFHIPDQGRFSADEAGRFAAEPLRIQWLAVKRLGEVVDDFQLRIAVGGKLLHVRAAIRVD